MHTRLCPSYEYETCITLQSEAEMTGNVRTNLTDEAKKCACPIGESWSDAQVYELIHFLSEPASVVPNSFEGAPDANNTS